MAPFLFACLVLAGLGTAVAAPPSRVGEGLEVVTPPGWTVLQKNRTHEMEMLSLLPTWEKADSWRDLLMYQEFKGRGGVVPRDILEGAIADGRAACPDQIAKPIQEGKVNGYDGAFLTVSCPARGEINLIKVVSGRDNLYMAQRTWRLAPFDPASPPLKSTDLDVWVRFLANLKPCDTRDGAHPCPPPEPPPGLPPSSAVRR
ncbi:MAG: hypothetical protein ABT940_06770 [Alphaproteobacteria bacterium]